MKEKILDSEVCQMKLIDRIKESQNDLEIEKETCHLEYLNQIENNVKRIGSLKRENGELLINNKKYLVMLKEDKN